VAHVSSKDKLELVLRASERVASGLQAEAEVLDHVIKTNKKLKQVDVDRLIRMADRLRTFSTTLAFEIRAESVSSLRHLGAGALAVLAVTADLAGVTAFGWAVQDRVRSRETVATTTAAAREVSLLCDEYDREFSREVHEAIERHVQPLEDLLAARERYEGLDIEIRYDLEGIRSKMLSEGRYGPAVVDAVIAEAAKRVAELPPSIDPADQSGEEEIANTAGRFGPDDDRGGESLADRDERPTETAQTRRRGVMRAQ
jgi:hypothetical protein